MLLNHWYCYFENVWLLLAPNIEEASSILGSICCNAEIPDLTPTGRLHIIKAIIIINAVPVNVGMNKYTVIAYSITYPYIVPGIASPIITHNSMNPLNKNLFLTIKNAIIIDKKEDINVAIHV